MTNDKTIRVGFIGAGANTRLHHIPKLKAQPGIELVAVANRTKESGERVAREFGIARVHGDWREIVEAKDVDAVCIGTWPYTHCEMTLAALAAGKHVLCEARMAMNAAEGRRMLDAARRAPSLVSQLVPAPHTLEVDSTHPAAPRRGVSGRGPRGGASGRPGQFRRAGRAHALAAGSSLSGHNILNMGIWYEAMSRWLGPARRVTAVTKISVPRRRDASGAMQDVRVPDHVDILAIFGSGARAHLRFSSRDRARAAARGLALRHRGHAAARGQCPPPLRRPPRRQGAAEIAIPADQRIGWRVEEEFVDAIRGTETITRTNFEDGVRYMEFTDAVAKSAASGQAVEVAEL